MDGNYPEPLRPHVVEIRAAIDEIKRVFGAPGDHGYGTPEGEALFRLFRAQVALHNALFVPTGDA